MIIKKVLKSILPDSYRVFLRRNFKFLHVLHFKYNVLTYNRTIHKKVDRIKNSNRINIMFYVFNLAMWKSDKLLKLLKENPRFNVFVVPFLVETDSIQYNKANNEKIVQYFRAKSIEVREGFNFSTNKQIHVDSFNADIVFYPQPYIIDINVLPHKALMAYIPYCYIMEDMAIFHNTLFQNICWRMYYPTQMHKEMEEKYAFNKAVNVKVVGYPMADYLLSNDTIDYSMWKINNSSLKRVIWAPHHSILSDDPLDYSNFLEIADGMLEIASKYKEKMQFIFKPHPRLKAKLYQLPSWGVDKTDAYYAAWAESPNCNMVDGNYVELFRSSDCMIHDCSSFTGEYLYLNKPVLFVTKKERVEQFNDFAQQCFDVHYKGKTLKDIETFLENVLNEIDILKNDRTTFINNVLLSGSNKKVSEIIYNDIVSSFKG